MENSESLPHVFVFCFLLIHPNTREIFVGYDNDLLPCDRKGE